MLFLFLNFCPYFATTTTKDTRILHAWKQFKHNLREFQVSCNISKSVIKDLLKFRSTIHKQNVLVILKLCNSIFNYLMVVSLTKILYCLSCQQGIHQKTHYFQTAVLTHLNTNYLIYIFCCCSSAFALTYNF